MQQDLTGHFQCPVCLQTAKEAVESSCCTKIFCLVCIQSSLSKYGCCPCCRSTECKLQENRYARKIISQLKVPCQYCRAHVETGEMSQHLLKCPEVVTECSFCKNSFKQAEIVQHSLLVHKQETKDKLLELLLQNRAESQKKVKGGNEISSLRNSEEEEEQNWFGKKINRDGRMAIFGTVAKYYCGGKLIGKCKCCDGNCGPDNGENCDACMEMDIKRMRLPRGFLVNAHGYPSKCTDQNPYCTRTIKERGGLFSSTDKKCTPLTRCSECETLRFSLLLGRYKNLY